jgi:hypothetical protein
MACGRGPAPVQFGSPTQWWRAKAAHCCSRRPSPAPHCRRCYRPAAGRRVASPESAFLQRRAAGELDQITLVRALSDRVAIIPLFTAEPAGEQRLAGLTKALAPLT